MPHDPPRHHRTPDRRTELATVWCTEQETNTSPADWPTAHVGYRPAGYDLWGRRVRARYHAVTDQDLTIGTDTRIAGDALCGSYGPWADIPDGLFPPLVSCEKCRHIATRDHITIIGSDA